MSVESWLRGLGLERYLEAFLENGVTPEILHQLSPEDLKEIGVLAVGHRRQLLSAIDELRTESHRNAAILREVPLAGLLPAHDAAAQTQSHGEGERRQLSVMFCDFVGSTALSAKLDPEDFRQVINAYHSRVAATVSRFGGFVAEFLGDGVLVYFGWPRGNESDPEQAINAGLEVIEAVTLLDDGTRSCHIRIGVATGLVIVGDVVQPGSTKTQAAVGQTPNLAARLQSFAEPDTIVIDHATHARIGSLFVCEPLAEVELKGFEKPVSAWRVYGKSLVRSRFEALHGAAITPLIGRDEELDLLLRRWRQAKEGAGRVVLIVGEPGIGKSRLIAEFESRLSGAPHTRLRYFCSAQHQNSALSPVIAQLEHGAGFLREDTAADRFRKLRRLLTSTHPSQTDLALFADLMTIGTPELGELNLSPQRKKEMTFAALTLQLERLAAVRPVLILLEDGHWADPTTIELFDLIIEKLRGLPVLLVITFRPEYQPPWVGRAGVTLLTMSRLDHEHAAEMVERVAAASFLSSDLRQKIATQADGVPLFVEELTKTVLERGLDLLGDAPLVVPETLQASLMARLDRFPAAKQVAQIGSVIGREFREDLLAAIAVVPPPVQREGLAQLIASGLVFCRGETPNALYIFKHALVQDTAYESLPKSRRTPIHASIVRALLALIPDIESKQPDLLAHHCSHAGLLEEAVSYFLRAAERAAERSAMPESRAFLKRGLTITPGIRNETERRLREAELKLLLGNVHTATLGYASAERAEALADAAMVSRTLDPHTAGATKLMSRILFGNWSAKIHRAELEDSRKIAQEFIEFARDQDFETQLISSMAYGMNCAFDGHLSEAKNTFLLALGEYDTRGLNSTFAFATDAAVLLLAQSSRALACLGLLDQAAARAAEAMDRAESVKHLPSLATTLATVSDVSWLTRDIVSLRDRSAALVSLAEEQRFGFWLARGKSFSGWAAAADGRIEEGRRLALEGLTGLQVASITLYRPHTLSILADIHMWAGERQVASDMLEEALALAEQTGGVWNIAELQRRKGQLVLDDPALAELHFRAALKYAQKGSYKLWELRAATSLARLWLRQDRVIEARELLSSVYDTFTEGFSAPDLQDAAAVLAEA